MNHMTNIYNKQNKFKINLPNSFYKQLPYPFTCLLEFDDPVDRDVYFCSMITALGSVMPNYFGSFRDNQAVSPHLYMFIGGESGSGKGLAGSALRALYGVNQTVLEHSRAERAEYLSSCAEEDKAKAPRERTLLVSANTTEAGLLEDMYANQEHGCLFYSTEAEIALGSMKSEFGRKISPIMRCAFHNEMISKRLKTDSLNYQIDFPRLGVLLTGTFSSLKFIFDNESESGLLSRLLMCLIPEREIKISIGPTKSIGVTKVFKQYISSIYRDMSSRTNPLPFEMTPELHRGFEELMDRSLKKLSKISPSYKTSILRMSLSIYRISMILAAFKNPLGLKQAGKVVANKDMLPLLIHLVDFFTQNLLLAGDNFGIGRTAVRLKVSPKMILGLLEDEFTYSEMCDLIRTKTSSHLSAAKVRTARYLSKLASQGLVKKTETGYKKL